MILGGLARTSTIDFPGNIACVVFTRGCDLDCFFCHNRGLIPRTGGPDLSENEFFSFLERRAGLLDGVVVSGGEPTLQSDLPQFIRRIRSLGFSVKLDTNGMHPDVVEDLLGMGLLDYCAVDVKAPHGECEQMCGRDAVSFEIKTLELLARSSIKYEARTTLFPGLTLSSLVKLLGELPVMPLWRMGYFRMPRVYRPEHEDRLALRALTRGDLLRCEGHLRSIQENIVI